MAKKLGLGVLREELARSARPYPAELRRRVIDHVRRARDAGAGLERIATELGVAPQTLRSWVPSKTFRPVEIVAKEARGAAATVVVVDDRSGVRIEGLDIATAVEVVKQLR